MVKTQGVRDGGKRRREGMKEGRKEGTEGGREDGSCGGRESGDEKSRREKMACRAGRAGRG
ncbi:MAG: hypothetical protein LBQ79_13395 [Deltaproteobacteria bacterium]|nr:hypothetical protein [Deltaproteobacteria bacterium]